MTSTSTMHEACGHLLESFPEAVEAYTEPRGMKAMTLIVADGGGYQFFRLSHEGQGKPYVLHEWRGPCVAEVTAGGKYLGPGEWHPALTAGVPVARSGSLWGWVRDGAVTTLVASYGPTKLYPEPTFTIMPHAGIPECNWAPFCAEPLFGAWFWEHYHAGTIVSLGDLIAAAPGAVFWADTVATLGSGLIAVTDDVASPVGWTLPVGLFAYYQVLRDGVPLPDPGELFAAGVTTDLAPRFKRERATA